MKPEQWSLKEHSLDKTFDLSTLLGTQVVSERGSPLGKVCQVRVNANLQFQGIFVRRRPLQKTRYFSKEYIAKISSEGIVLSIEPSYLLLGRKVITPEGEIVGTVISVERKGTSNVITKITMRRSLFSKRDLTLKDLKSIGASLVLKEKYVL